MFPTLQRVKNEAEAAALIAAAKADNDAMIYPTHGVYKNGEIAGAWSIASIPLVLCWHKSDTIKARDSILMRNTVDAVLDSQGVETYLTACNSNSPYIGHMEKFGYQPIWPTNLFAKNVLT